jgi:hypothetical protein
MFKNNSVIYLLIAVLIAPIFSFCQTSLNTPQSIDKQEVYRNDFVRNTLYTWTTDEQINELRKNKILLTKSKSETQGYASFDVSLRDSSLKNNPIAKLLQEEQFAKKRFAWSNAWATVMGWKGESYGNNLVKIVLHDSAIIGRFDSFNKQEPFSFSDFKGEKLTTDYVIKNKNRIAAIYHLNYYEGKRKVFKRKNTGTYSQETKKAITQKANILFREFVIINEKMIKNWSYGTSDIKNEIKSEITLLKQFQESNKANEFAYNSRNYGGWYNISTDNVNADNVAFKYNNSKCFENNNYLFNNKTLQKIVDKLEFDSKQQSLELMK